MKSKGGLSIYFDDAIIYTRDDQTHLQKLSEFLQILIDNDLKCSVTKSFWMHDRIRYLGFDIGPEGISANLIKLAYSTDHFCFLCSDFFSF
jgi:hypothetical protein